MVKNNNRIVQLQALSAEAERAYGQELEEILALRKQGFISEKAAAALKAAARDRFKAATAALYEEIRRLGA